MEELVSFAMRVAWRMTKDPEGQSIANIAVFRAIQSYDATTGVPIRRWIAKKVKQGIWCHWRKIRIRREEFKAELWWDTNVSYSYTEENLGLDQSDWQVLCEHFIDSWPVDVVARRHGVSTHTMRKRLRAAVVRLQKAYDVAPGSPTV